MIIDRQVKYSPSFDFLKIAQSPQIHYGVKLSAASDLCLEGKEFVSSYRESIPVPAKVTHIDIIRIFFADSVLVSGPEQGREV